MKTKPRTKIKKNEMNQFRVQCLIVLYAIVAQVTAHEKTFNPGSIVDTIPVLMRHSKGTVKDSGQALKMLNGSFIKNGTFKTYYPNGNLKDSSFFMNAEMVGERRTYFSNGTLKQHFVVSDYNDTLKLITGKIYRRNANLKSEGQLLGTETFGEMRKYRFGSPWLYSDMHKGKRIRIAREYKRGKHIQEEPIAEKITADRITLIKDGKTKRLTTGTITKLGLIGDSSELTHCLVEGFTGDAIVVSRFSYDMTDSRKPLKFDSVATIAMQKIQFFEFSRKNTNFAFWTAFTLHIAGAVVLTEAILMPPLFGNSEAIISETMLPFFAVGIACYIPGKLLYRLTVPKKYDVESEWNIEKK